MLFLYASLYFSVTCLPLHQFHFASRHCDYFSVLHSLVADRNKKTVLGGSVENLDVVRLWG